eukprot:TRINITY_DN2267_c0_g1_i1.p1 TRINITY_DN2267_c0_g1~~TRINITY_DN2267_c0_g1_i1.p1  ORF type:complete len:396 (-),score=62.94 TRINITY_DN2267_c0_g1_i1:193-1380(-)
MEGLDLPEEERIDIFERLDADCSKKVLSFLVTPADIARVASVSRTWRQFVIEFVCARDLCLSLFPETSSFTSVFEYDQNNGLERNGSKVDSIQVNLVSEHRVYLQLAYELVAPPIDKSCIKRPIFASSTDNYPDESIANTLFPRPIEDDRPSYWSSEGDINPEAPESLTYMLSSKLCVVHEVSIHPFQAYFQIGYPIYSAKAVRFRLGGIKPSASHAILTADDVGSSHRHSGEDYYWTYTSPEFPMQQEDRLQTFKLPRPVLCIGGILQIELLGRVQKQEIDGLYYVCVCHVNVVGRPLVYFDFDSLDGTQQYVLKYSRLFMLPDPFLEDISRASSKEEDTGSSSGWQTFAERLRQITWDRSILSALLRNTTMANLMHSDQYSDEEDDDEEPIHD